MINSYLSVSLLNNYIKSIFEAEVSLQNIFVYGEVSSYNVSGGIAYFNLKDESGMISCVLFGANQFQAPKIGDMVLVNGSMNYYAKGGKLSFNAISIMPYGRGILYEKFLKLKEDLEKRGYFDVSRKKEIPKRVKRIGVVTSQTGAVIRDIIDVTHRRNNSIDIVLYSVKVQGVGAEYEIAAGIDFFSNYDKVDGVIVARGGGSMEDLEPFNSEIVANAVFNCKKPIVSAVGHETDFTIIDFVSDLRAPTPSAAAELVAWDKNLEIDNICFNLRRIENVLDSRIKLIEKELAYGISAMNNFIDNLMFKYDNTIDKKIMNLDCFENYITKKESYIANILTRLESFNPQKIASMGYSKIIKNNNVICSKQCIKLGDQIKISMIDGNIGAVVNEE